MIASGGAEWNMTTTLLLTVVPPMLDPRSSEFESLVVQMAKKLPQHSAGVDARGRAGAVDRLGCAAGVGTGCSAGCAARRAAHPRAGRLDGEAEITTLAGSDAPDVDLALLVAGSTSRTGCARHPCDLQSSTLDDATDLTRRQLSLTRHADRERRPHPRRSLPTTPRTIATSSRILRVVIVTESSSAT